MNTLLFKIKDIFNPQHFEHEALKVVLLYAILATLYIWVSDFLVSIVFNDPKTITSVSTIKGWFFVSLTTLLLFVLVKQLLKKVIASQSNEYKVLEELEISEANYKSLTEQIPAIVYRATINDSSETMYISPRIESLGYSAQEWLASPNMWLELMHPDDKSHTEAILTEAHRSKSGFSCEYRLKAKNGDWVSFQDEAKIIVDPKSNTSYLQGIMLDITERKSTELQMRKLSQAVEQSPVSTIITNKKGEIEYVNKAFEHNSGYTFAEVIGKKPKIHTSGKTPKATIESMWATITVGKTWRGSFINRHKNGTEYIERAVVAPVRDNNDKVTHYLSVQQDITLQTKAEEEAYNLSNFDILTNLPNRNLLMQNLEQCVCATSTPDEAYYLILINLDQFKNLNEARGHRFGDELLIQATDRLRNLKTDATFIARYGGDEFGVILKVHNLDDFSAKNQASLFLEQLSNAIKLPFYILDSQIYITVSIGVVFFPFADSNDPLAILRHAETALHLSKGQGGNNFLFFESVMAQTVEKNFLIERDLHHAIDNHELDLYLQSQVNASEEIVGAEALIRWQHPEYGFIPPNAFISVAENSDLITQIDYWVFSEVCKVLSRPELGDFKNRISINISPRTFRQANLIDWIKKTLSNSNVNGNLITLEVTERLVLDNIEEVINKMKLISELGIHFSIDDFGTGYSSLSYLKKLPIHELKIDKSFVQDAPVDEGDAALVEAILGVAQKLKLNVVAEGVETRQQADFLISRANLVLQGYLFSEPTPIDSWIECYRVRGNVTIP